jgi:hypothetical protein
MPKWTGAPTDEPPKVIVVQQSTNVTMKKRLYDIRWYQPKDRYGIELFDEHKFSFSGRAIVILLEAVLTNANWPNVVPSVQGHQTALRSPRTSARGRVSRA